MTESVFDIETTELHRTARFTFIPWLVRLFSDGPVRGDSSGLPTGDESVLTNEVVDAVKDICNRVCWDFLARQCGWRKISSVTPQNSENFAEARLWHHAPTLHFSTSSFDLLLELFNATRKQGNLSDLAMPDCLEHNGDLLIHHLAFRRLRTTPQAFGCSPDDDWNDWLPNPLNALFDTVGYRSFESSETKWQRLCEPDFAPFVPWLGRKQIGIWNDQTQEQRNAGYESGLVWLEALTFLISDFGKTVEKAGRIDLADFILDLLTHHGQQSEIDLATFKRETKNLTLKEKREQAVGWTDFLALTQPLEEWAKACLAVHPVERTGAQKCYLAKWEEINFQHTIDVLRDLSQKLRPTFQ